MKKYAKYPALAVTLAIMAVIFVLSSQPAELSTKVSRAVTETVQAGRIKPSRAVVQHHKPERQRPQVAHVISTRALASAWP